MRLAPLSPEDRAAQLLADQREMERLGRRVFVRAIFECIAALAVGLALIGWSVHTTDLRWAGTAFWGGLVLGYGGIGWACARAYWESDVMRQR